VKETHLSQSLTLNLKYVEAAVHCIAALIHYDVPRDDELLSAPTLA